MIDRRARPTPRTRPSRCSPARARASSASSCRARGGEPSRLTSMKRRRPGLGHRHQPPGAARRRGARRARARRRSPSSISNQPGRARARARAAAGMPADGRRSHARSPIARRSRTRCSPCSPRTASRRSCSPGFMRVLTARVRRRVSAARSSTRTRRSCPRSPGVDAPAQALAHGVKVTGVTDPLRRREPRRRPDHRAGRGARSLAGDDAAALHARIQREEHRAAARVVQRSGGGRARRAKVGSWSGRPCRVTRTTWSSSATTSPRWCARRCARAAACARSCSATIARRATRSARTSCRSSRRCGRSRTGTAGRARAQGAPRRARAAPQAARAADRRAARRAGPAHRSRRRSPRGRARARARRRAADAWLARWDEGQRDRARCSIRCSPSEHAFPGVGFFERREVARLAELAADGRDRVVDRRAEPMPHAPLWRHLAAIALRHPAPPPAAIARAIDAWRAGPACRCAATATRCASCSSRS